MDVDHEWSSNGLVPRPIEIPEPLRTRPFTTAQAARLRVSIHVLRGRRFVQLFRGVWVSADLLVDESVRIAAARLLLPGDAALSHVSALRRLGVRLGSERPLHFSTNTTAQTRLPGVRLHRRLGKLTPGDVDGVPTLGPDRTFVDCATLLGLRDLVRAGDWLVRLGLTTPAVLREYAAERHLDGVVRARRATRFVASRVDSVTETDVRLLLHFARLPRPDVNGWICDGAGNVLGRGDLVFREHWVVVEYDGWHHERDARQRQKDHLRRERLEAAGWKLIVITSADMADPSGIVKRVHAALVARGYRGAKPVMSTTWRRWFAAA
jgi:hypothetical protein